MNHNTIERVKPLLSLCIPTDGTAKWVIPVVESIYSQNVDHDFFEVVITDNGKSEELSNALNEKRYSNLKYFKSDYEGFTNQIFAIKQAQGSFRKMLNHRSCILEGKLNKIIELIKRYNQTRPIIYFSDEALAKNEDIIECNNYDELIKNLHYYFTWSAGFGIWDNDIPKLETINPNKMFPHIAMMLDVREKSSCIIWNGKYQEMLPDPGKGGYNVFNAFAVIFLNLLKEYVQQEKISIESYVKTKKKLFGFLTNLYQSEVLNKSIHSFDLSNIRKSVSTHYSLAGYLFMVTIALSRYYKNKFLNRICSK